MRAAADCGLGVMAHANGEHAIMDAAEAGVRSIEHGFFMSGGRSWQCRKNRSSGCQRSERLSAPPYQAAYHKKLGTLLTA